MFWKEKKPSYKIKKYVLYSQKIRYFPKGLTHNFGQKFELSLLFVFIENRTSNDVWDVLDKKEALLDYKKCISYSRKTGYFAKGLTHDFDQKFDLSSLFVFIENTPRNDVWG